MVRVKVEGGKVGNDIRPRKPSQKRPVQKKPVQKRPIQAQPSTSKKSVNQKVKVDSPVTAKPAPAKPTKTPVKIDLELTDEKPEIKPAKKRKWPIFLAIFAGLIAIVGGAATYYFWWMPQELAKNAVDITKRESAEETKYYSLITGLEYKDAALVNTPVYCMQIPNGMDGARPQVGLTQAGVVYEAIAEAGITRFAAIFQNPTSTALGPIRSLRLYYLEWDTPYNCTIVHAGGSDEAISAVRRGGYRDLTESYSYMYRSSSSNAKLTRRWNNLFTSAGDLSKFSSNRGYTTSQPKGFHRLTTAEAVTAKFNATAAHPLKITEPNTEDTDAVAGKVNTININFGNIASYNTVYHYNAATNSYNRANGNGVNHTSYLCPEGLNDPVPELKCGEPIQVSPTVVIAMRVQESKAADRYHEKIVTTGSGNVVIFQNGTATEGTWSRGSINEQFVFKDSAGKEIILMPGQTWVAAVPQYGAVSYK